MIRGPEKTPYEDGLFFFDFQLSAEYPKAPPLCHYISYCSDRLNPNLYEDGKVCVSLLGTWSGKGTEVWTLHSNLLQVIVSIQGKIFSCVIYKCIVINMIFILNHISGLILCPCNLLLFIFLLF